MSEIIGRQVALTIGTAIATARTKSFSINNEPVDITSDTHAGVQTMLEAPGRKSVECSVSGMFDTTETGLLDLALSGTDIEQSCSFKFGSGASPLTVAGDFVITNFEITGEYEDATTFSASFNSSGAFAKAT